MSSRSRSSSRTETTETTRTTEISSQEDETTTTEHKRPKHKKKKDKSEKKSKKRKDRKHHSPGKKRHRSRSRGRSDKKKRRSRSRSRKRSDRSKSSRSRRSRSRDRSRDRRRRSRDRRDRKKSPISEKTKEERAKQLADLTQRNREKFRLYASGDLEKQLMTNGVHSPTSSPAKKTKLTVSEAFGFSSSDEETVPPPTRSSYGSFKMKLDQKRALGRPAWKGGWTSNSETSELPILTPAPPPPTKVSKPNGMPTLTPRPEQQPPQPVKEPEVKKEPEIKRENGVEDITDDEMDISDSDEYDEEQMNASIDEVKALPPLQPAPGPPPLRSRPPPSANQEPSKSTTNHLPPPLLAAPTNTTKEPEIPPFKKILENEYICSKELVKASKESRRMECECREGHCDDDCLNRMSLIECSNRCRIGENCRNKRFQKKQYQKLEIFAAREKGHGLRACSHIKNGDFIIEYIGEVVSTRDFKKRSHEYSNAQSRHHYFMELTRGATIDATKKGQISRFINHSCDPNAETQKWTVNGIVRVGFFAIRDILKGEEITFDYQFIHFGKGQTCLCGADNCRGTIGRQAAYRGNKDDDKDVDYSKEILAIKKMDSTDDMMKLGRLMALTKHDDTKARQKSLSLVKSARNDLQRTFMSYHGLDILWSFAKDDQFDEGELKPELIDLLHILPITTRDKVEDSGLLAIVEKWSKRRNDECAKKAGKLAEKWRKCLRRIPLRPKSATDNNNGELEKQEPVEIKEETELNKSRRRSPRLRPPTPELTEEEIREREAQREAHRRQFEEQVKWEAEAKETVKLSIDDRLREALQDDTEDDVFDAPSPGPDEDYDFPFEGGPKTPPQNAPQTPQWDNESYWEKMSGEDKKGIVSRLCRSYVPSESDEKLEIGFGTVLARSGDSSSSGAMTNGDSGGRIWVSFTQEEIAHFKTITELARLGLEQRDKAQKQAKEREKRRVEVALRMAAQEEARKKRLLAQQQLNEASRPNSETNSTNHNPAQSQNADNSEGTVTELPELWASARDAEGNVYYYHTQTRETTWDPPKAAEPDKHEKEAKLKKQLEKYIAELLLSYRDNDAQVGRITKDDDYRHLIKRLAYGLLKRVVGELKTYRMNEKAKNMASKYCHKYMLRQGKVYVRKQTLASTSSKNSSQLPNSIVNNALSKDV